MNKTLKLLALVLLVTFFSTGYALSVNAQMEKKNPASESLQDWEILSPETVVSREPVRVKPHPSTLEGKTIVLRRNHKPNSDKVLDRVAELILEKVKSVKIIKAWEVIPGTDVEYPKPDALKQIAQLKPDIVISSQGD